MYNENTFNVCCKLSNYERLTLGLKILSGYVKSYDELNIFHESDRGLCVGIYPVSIYKVFKKIKRPKFINLSNTDQDTLKYLGWRSYEEYLIRTEDGYKKFPEEEAFVFTGI